MHIDQQDFSHPWDGERWAIERKHAHVIRADGEITAYWKDTPALVQEFFDEVERLGLVVEDQSHRG